MKDLLPSRGICIPGIRRFLRVAALQRRLIKYEDSDEGKSEERMFFCVLDISNDKFFKSVRYVSYIP